MIDQNNNPAPVLQDLSVASLTGAIEESLAAFPLILARLPGAEIYDTPNLLWVATGVPIDSYNGVFRSILDPLRADTQIEEIRQEFRRRRLPMLWQLGPHLPWRYYLGTFKGKPIATALLFFGAGVAALHSVVTLPQARYKGIGTAMTLAALREARRAGYRVAILTASPYGVRIYGRIGFREYCTISRYTQS